MPSFSACTIYNDHQFHPLLSFPMVLQEMRPAAEGVHRSEEEDHQRFYPVGSRCHQEDGDCPRGQKGLHDHPGYHLPYQGLLKLRRNIQGEKSIYSIVELSEIKQGKLSDHLMRKSWESLPSNAYWRQPHNIRSLSFDLQVNLPSLRIWIV